MERIDQILTNRQKAEEKERFEHDLVLIRERCKTFSGFVKEAWHVIEPRTKLVWGFELQAMCDHLEAITLGKLIPRLIINVPPGSSKSTVVSVLWQAWEWGPMGLPSQRFISTSFDGENVTRDTRKTRNLVMSDWFKRLWPNVKLTRTGETSFENTDTGFREGMAFRSITGKRGDRFTIDDPHSVNSAESEVERAKSVQNFMEGGLNRLNDLDKSAIVVVMQRLHEGDLSGALLAAQLGFVHLRIPMRFEADTVCETPLPWRDPRTYDGQIMNPLRFSENSLLPFEAQAFVWAGQYQQRPTPREGGLFKKSWFNSFVDQAPPGTLWVRHWDLAATKGGAGARTAGVKMGRMPNGRYVVGHVEKFRERGDVVRTNIVACAARDGRVVKISLPQDPGQAGKVQVADYGVFLAGYTVIAEPETGDKVTRAEPFASQCALGNVDIVRGDWNDSYIDELCLFPGALLKDQVDASSGAFGQLVRMSNYSLANVG